MTAFQQAETNVFAVPKGWPQPAYTFAKNPLSPAKVELGRKLFYDPIFSRDSTVSCASCHLSFTAFTHIDHELSHGIDNRIGTRNAPTLINLAWGKAFMWDGAVNHLDMQPLDPITDADEMDETIEHVVQKLQTTKLYPTLFREAFGDSTITGEHTLKALAQFMLTFVSANAKYDKIMRGEAGVAFTEYEQRGYKLFQAHCASCHSEPLFTNNGFANNGLPPDPTLRDAGRARVTTRSEDSLTFKVPTLRNVEVSYPYMHDGRFSSLQMVLFHYTEGIHHSSTLAPALQKKIVLSEDDKRSLIAFLHTLTDEEFLHNPRFQYRP
jgi:cytochrome c peroxidase